jgi:uncharacterized protein YukE
MATNVDRLIQKLEDLLRSLQQFDNSLSDEFGSLDVSWARLKQTWEGTAGQAFGGDWDKTRHSIRQYLDVSKKHQTYLAKRIEALKAFQRDGGPL